MAHGMAATGPVEGWIAYWGDNVGVVKGCQQPLPKLYIIPRLVGSVKVKNEPWRLCGLVECKPTPCLPEPLPTIEAWRVRLLAPWDAVPRIDGCSTRTCTVAREMLEYIESTGARYYGITGSLAYSPAKARDIDIVVYGFNDGLKVYRLLADLRAEGVTEPLKEPDTPWEPGLRRSLSQRLLLGRIKGIAYSIRLVTCTAPEKCLRVGRLGWLRVCGVLKPLSAPWATPVYYRLFHEHSVVVVKSYRIRYTELANTHACVEGFLEKDETGIYLVPDRGGSVTLLNSIDKPG